MGSFCWVIKHIREEKLLCCRGRADLHSLGFAGMPGGARVEDLSHIDSANFACLIARRNGVGEERSEPLGATCPVLGLKGPKRVAFLWRGFITLTLHPLLAPSRGAGVDLAVCPRSFPVVTALSDATSAWAPRHQDVVTPVKRLLPGGPCSERLVVHPGGWKHQSFVALVIASSSGAPKLEDGL